MISDCITKKTQVPCNAINPRNTPELRMLAAVCFRKTQKCSGESKGGGGPPLSFLLLVSI